MEDQNKTKEQLIEELVELRQRIVDLKKSEAGRRKTEESLQKASYYLDNVNDTLIVINANREIITVNKEFSNLWGYSSDEVLGKSVFILFPQEEMPVHLAEMEKAIFTKAPCNFEAFALTKSGQKVPLSIRGSAMFDNDGKLEGLIGIFRDITERKRMEEKLHTASITDELTGLYNRRGFLTLADQQLKVAYRMKRGILLVYADVDGLKFINDGFGHHDGDLLLSNTANFLKHVFRESDIIARIGGDEFVVFSLETTDIDIKTIRDRFEKNLDTYNANRDHIFKMSLSIGIAYYKKKKPYSLDEILNHADQLMYEQKKQKGRL